MMKRGPALLAARVSGSPSSSRFRDEGKKRAVLTNFAYKGVTLSLGSVLFRLMSFWAGSCRPRSSMRTTS